MRYILLTLTLLLSSSALAAQERIAIVTGHSTLINSPTRVTRVAVTSPEVLDALVITPYEIQVNAREPGSTSLILWNEDGAAIIYTVESQVDVAQAREILTRLYPGEGINVEAVGTTLLLSGTVGSAALLADIEASLAGLGAPVVSRVEARERQVRLQVRFAEVTRSALRETGLRELTGEGSLDQIRLGRADGDFEFNLSDVLDIAVMSPTLSLSSVIDMLQSTGEFRSLAEPNLTAVEGNEANFLAGGEFPFVVSRGEIGGMSVEWKEFGVRLSFTPEIHSDGTIRLEVQPEVSSLDFANGIDLEGYRLPALVTRRAATTVDLRSGQTFAIAGLLDHELTRSAEGLPFLSSIPILGNFFGGRALRDRRTELLVLVTPVIVDETSSNRVPTGEPSEWGFNRHVGSRVTP